MFLLTWAGTNTTGTFSVDQNGVGFQINSANTFPSGYWYHVAMVYNGTNTLTLYVNGVAQGTYSVTPAGMAASANATEIGAYANNQGWYGEITNVRVVKGVAVYTGNFTVPTDTLQATQSAGTNISAISGTQTQLLLNTTQAQTYTDSSTYNRSATTSGTFWTPSTPFVGATTSNYSCIARVSYTSDAIQFTVIDQTDTSWQTGGVGGPALLGVFRLPVTFTAYSPTTMLSNNNNWC